MKHEDITGYTWGDAQLTDAHSFLIPALVSELGRVKVSEKRVFDLGCGNGSVANILGSMGWSVQGVDPSTEGIEQANTKFPKLGLEQGSAYDDLRERFGRFPVVISLEVVEHVYSPRKYAETLFSLVESGGTAIISTPYHGYFKNLALALSGKMDKHFTALWDHGHIKFWSINTLTQLLSEAGFVNIRFRRVGRIPILAKSMVAIVQKP